MRRPSRGVVVALATAAVLTAALMVTPGPAAAGAAAPPARAAAATVGTLTIDGSSSEPCPEGGYECSDFTATCAAPYEAVAPVTGRMADGAHTNTRLKGVVMLFVGNEGMEYWGGTPERRAFLDDLHTRGYRTIEIAWDEPYAQGTEGYLARTCLPGAVIEWGAAEYAASGAQPAAGDGVCGFCLVGTSAGTAQAAFPLVFHGLGDAVDAVVEMSGPAEGNLFLACSRSTPVSPYQYLEAPRSFARTRVDNAWDDGAVGPGKCESNPSDATFQSTWEANSLATGTNARHSFPTTRWHFIWGSKDGTGAVGQGRLFFDALHAGGTPMLGHDCMNGPHDLASSPKALRQLKTAIEWRPADGPDHPPPLGEPTVTPRCQLTRG